MRMSKKKMRMVKVIVPGVAAAAIAVVAVNAKWGQKTEETTASAYRTDGTARDDNIRYRGEWNRYFWHGGTGF